MVFCKVFTMEVGSAIGAHSDRLAFHYGALLDTMLNAIGDKISQMSFDQNGLQARLAPWVPRTGAGKIDEGWRERSH